MRVSVSDVRAAMQSDDGWQLFVPFMNAIVQFQDRLLHDDERSGKQATMDEFEALASLADFVNYVIAGQPGAAQSQPDRLP